jgi:hypothetical protein
MPSDLDLYWLLLGQKTLNKLKAKCTVQILIRWLIWIYTVCPWDNSHIPWSKGYVLYTTVTLYFIAV